MKATVYCAIKEDASALTIDVFTPASCERDYTVALSNGKHHPSLQNLIKAERLDDSFQLVSDYDLNLDGHPHR